MHSLFPKLPLDSLPLKGVMCMLDDWWSSSDLAKVAKFRIEITEVWAHRNALVLAGTFGHDRISWSRIDGRLLYHCTLSEVIDQECGRCSYT